MSRHLASTYASRWGRTSAVLEALLAAVERDIADGTLTVGPHLRYPLERAREVVRLGEDERAQDAASASDGRGAA